jgi:hypothetical protein
LRHDLKRDFLMQNSVVLRHRAANPSENAGLSAQRKAQYWQRIAIGALESLV